MTRGECEQAINLLMQDIRDTVRKYDPKIKILNLAICEDNAWAFAFNKDQTKYLINMNSKHGFNEEE